VLDHFQLLKKESESRHDETETHQGQTRTNPRQKGSLGSQIITQRGSLPGFDRLIHFSQLPPNHIIAIPFALRLASAKMLWRWNSVMAGEEELARGEAGLRTYRGAGQRALQYCFFPSPFAPVNSYKKSLSARRSISKEVDVNGNPLPKSQAVTVKTVRFDIGPLTIE
jgi:hypothetical protein